MAVEGKKRISLFRRYRRDQSGVTAIEFAILAMPFFMLIMAIVEFGLAFLVSGILDNAVLEASRLIRTGQVQKQSLTKEDFREIVCENMGAIFCNEARIIIDVRNYGSFGEINTPPEIWDETEEDEADRDKSFYDPGSASDIVLTRVIYRWPMFSSLLRFDAGDTSDGFRNLRSTVIFKSEPFPT